MISRNFIEFKLLDEMIKEYSKTYLQKFCIGLITIHNEDHTYTILTNTIHFVILEKYYVFIRGPILKWIKWSLQVTDNCKEIRNNGVNTAIVLVPYTPVFCFSGWHLRSWSSFMDMISSKSTLFSRVSPPHKVSISWNWCFAENFPTGLTSGPSG